MDDETRDDVPESQGEPTPAIEYQDPVTIFLQAFLRGNYFYVLSAVAFMAGCYLMMNAPFITGTVFWRTLKSFLVLQGYEGLLLGTAAMITFALGRGGDVVTLFLIALVLMLDPTFFGNAFHTIRQGEIPVWPPLICVLSLVAAAAKFEVFRRLLGIRASPRFTCGFLLTAAIVWLSGLVLRSDSAADIAFFCYIMTWLPLVVIAATGMPSRAFASRSGPAPSRSVAEFAASVLPLLVIIHQFELTGVSSATFHLYNLSAICVALAFAALRSHRIRTPMDTYVIVDALLFFAVCMAFSGMQQIVAFDRAWPSPLVFTLGACGFVFAYGYWKTRTQAALYHAIAFIALGILGGVSVTIAKYGLPFLHNLADLIDLKKLLSAHSVGMAFTAVALVLAFYYRNLLLALFGAWGLIFSGFLFVKSPEWGVAELLQLLGGALLAYYFIKGERGENLQKTALLIIAIGIVKIVLWPGVIPALFLIAEIVIMGLLYRLLRQKVYLFLGVAGVVALLARSLKLTIRDVHPSLLALGAGAVLFALGVWATFKKAKMQRAVLEKDVSLSGPAGGVDSSDGSND